MQVQAPQPILVIDPIEAARLSRVHRDLHVSFDLFSTELQRLEATKMFLPEMKFPEQENSEEWAIIPPPPPSPVPNGIEKGPKSALDIHIESYRSYVAKRNAETRFWESVRLHDLEQSSSKYSEYDDHHDNDTVCAEKDYQLLTEDEKQEQENHPHQPKPTTLESFRRVYQAFIRK